MLLEGREDDHFVEQLQAEYPYCLFSTCFTSACSGSIMRQWAACCHRSLQDLCIGVQARDRPADEDARSLMWEWCHRLEDREAAVQAVTRHLGEDPMHVKGCLHAEPASFSS